MTGGPRLSLAIAVDDLAAARSFYGGLLGLPEGRSAERSARWTFYGHQLVAHLTSVASTVPGQPYGDEHAPPVPHVAIVLTVPEFNDLAERLRGHGPEFVFEPDDRFASGPGERWTMSFVDPANNILEASSFRKLTRSHQARWDGTRTLCGRQVSDGGVHSRS